MKDYEAIILLQGVSGAFPVTVKAMDAWQAENIIIQMYAQGDKQRISFQKYPTEKM